ncbi:MAG: polysaccharide deacetylase family protein [Verrucomicrobiaceae bacterium]|nr:polysaccharide deacetylase family protein [Verrucomicrobiaceae bacterium]
MIRRSPHRLVLALLALLIPLGGSVSCDKVKAKLQRLAEANKPKPPPPPEPALTPEEEKLDKTLQDPNLLAGAAMEEEVPKAQVFELNKSSVVSILGYHDFRDRGGSPMLIAADRFRQQMKAIKDAKIPVIPMRDLLAWKKGEKNIPDEAIVITMDDGWQGVYQYAFPVLKEFGFPFTMYLYSKYVNIGGRSMTWDQIREMIAFGAEVGSHSVSHENMTSKRAKRGKDRTEADQQLWIVSELKDSKDFLEKGLHLPVTSFAYPFGNHNDVIVQTAQQVGYETAVTVSPQKVTWDTPMAKLSRYIIHGDSDTNFKMATSFHGRGDAGSEHILAADAKDAQGNALVDLKPEPNSSVTDRRPVITANLTRLGSVEPSSIKLRVSGFGNVPARFDPDTFTVKYQVPHKIRREDCAVSLSFKRAATAPEEVVTWKFKINLAAAYLPKNDEVPLDPPAAVPDVVTDKQTGE